MRQFFQRFIHDTRGASAVEYGLIAASIAVAIIVAVSTFGDHPQSAYSSVVVSVDE